MSTALPSANNGATKAGSAEPRRLSSEDRRKQLLRNAIELFSVHGFSGTRTKDIAAASGVSEGILFRHFATKEDLFHAILDSYEAGSGNWLAEMKRLAEDRDDEAFVGCIATQILKSFREETAFHRLMLYARLEGHSMVDIFHERMGLPTFEFVRGYIAQRQQEGAFREGDPAALGMFLFSPALQYGITTYVFNVCKSPLSEEQAIQQITQFALAGLRAPLAEPSAASAETKQT